MKNSYEAVANYSVSGMRLKFVYQCTIRDKRLDCRVRWSIKKSVSLDFQCLTEQMLTRQQIVRHGRQTFCHRLNVSSRIPTASYEVKFTKV